MEKTLRIIWGLWSAALAALAVLKAPTSLCWYLAIGATEWGHILAMLALAPLFPGWRRSRAGRIGALFSGMAVLLSLSPLLRALILARRVRTQVASAFGDVVPRSAVDALGRPAPFILADVWHGVRSPQVCRTTLTYSTTETTRLELDVYRSPAQQMPAPCIVVIHGGSWQNDNKSQLPALNRYLAARGYVVAAINYRLAPQHRFPAAVEDVRQALSYLKSNASMLGIDPLQFVLLGRSAGGHLALLAAYSAADPAIRGVVAFYAPIDLCYAYRHPSNRRVIDTCSILEDFLGGSLDAIPAIYQQASPIRFVGPGTPPTLLIHGGRDELVHPVHSRMLADRLAELGRPHLLLTLPWATHAADAHFGGPSGQISTYVLERFLAAAMS